MKTFFIKTYGCQMNVYDSMIMSRIAKNLDLEQVNSVDNADLVILNTCHIREKATEKMYSELGQIKAIERKKSKKIITVVAGCVAQAEGDIILERANNVDFVVGPQSLHTLPELLGKVRRLQSKEISLEFEPVEKFDLINQQDYSHDGIVSSFLSIQEGCDKFCTYCVVPYTRGAEYSRPVAEILNESCKMVDAGIKEIILLGQNVNGYHGKNEDGTACDLGNLIKILGRIPRLQRIRYTTSHPSDMHESLYKAHAEEEKLMPYLHLPVQSGSNKILKHMNRKHTVEQYLAIISRLRKYNKSMAFSSDFIVGYPGETDRDFQDTLDLVKEVKFAQAFSFKYSPRPGTPSASYSDQIPEDIKHERLMILQDLLSAQQLEFNRSLIGTSVSVLFDRVHKNKDQIIGRTPYMQNVYLDTTEEYGTLHTIHINEAFLCSLSGNILDPYEINHENLKAKHLS
ncbi:MAG: tRNA-i(6)A37 thiotransferase enzyme MiaB [Candidatus Xenolissoclinum pacificiensis L6]|uniref:tRNA-2-methylthio-N(6)-dimethylallyladenosine synthase n=1 Tax=Candidatus Xenolissoclinum pacificiensis L6 TaxID=1401685 RepID=W2UZ50_9RICK|nr:MAG: tRNA-i(6)A37 thiotransferase enzyme MiaB [Candidatus Xenolissoclinum pacificiensis L6]